MQKEAKWYVLQTYSGHENKVRVNLEKIIKNRNLENMFTEIRIPTEIVTVIGSDGKRREVERKVFPGYVLVKMVLNDVSWYVVRGVRGVSGFVGGGTKPIPLTQEEMKSFDVGKLHKTEVSYKSGDVVEIASGPLEGFTGTVKEVNFEKSILKIEISILGREVEVELPLDEVIPIV
jgi:transcriptional antiterminator NusG